MEKTYKRIVKSDDKGLAVFVSKNVLVKNILLKLRGNNITLLADFIEIGADPFRVDIWVSLKRLIPIMNLLSMTEDLAADQLVDMYAVDYIASNGVIELTYSLLSFRKHYRFFVHVNIDAKLNESIKSVSDLFDSAGWLEREVFDMHGIFFEGNIQMKRILTDYGFLSNPLKKDFPVSGYYELMYDDETKNIAVRDVVFTPAFRSFKFNMPWSIGDTEFENIDVNDFIDNSGGIGITFDNDSNKNKK